jgi:hypothetical protein
MIGTVTKQPNENFPISVDFTRRLKSPEVLNNAAITSRKVADGSDSSSALLSGATFTGAIAQVRLIAGGTTGDDHVVQFRVTTSTGNVYECEVGLALREE